MSAQKIPAAVARVLSILETYVSEGAEVIHFDSLAASFDPNSEETFRDVVLAALSEIQSDAPRQPQLRFLRHD